MEDEIYGLNGLGNLLLRVVRGAKPGTFNVQSSGNIFVETDLTADSNEVKEYLLQASLASNIFNGTATFTVGSDSVTGSGFSSLAAGDTIKLNTNVLEFEIASVTSDTVLVLSSAYTDSSVSSGSVSGIYSAKKILFANASYDNIENTTSVQNFEYNSEKGLWDILDSSGATTFPASSTSFKDGITLNFISKGETGKPDLQIIGTIEEKVLPTVQVATSQVSLDPIPYPGDHSSLIVSMKLPGESSFSTLVYEEDFVVQYANSPLYETPLPPFEDRKLAKLMFLGNISYSQTVADNFSGQVNLVDGETDVTNLLEGSESISLDSSPLTEYSDYIVDRTAGVVTFVQGRQDESSVDSILYTNNVLNNGIVFTLGTGTFDSPDFSSPIYLKKGEDYNLNENSGIFRMVEGLTSDQILQIDYIVEGQPVEEILGAKEDVTDLRTDRFPVMPGTVSLAKKDTSGKFSPLVENQDFTLAYATGIITLGSTTDIDSLKISYVPASTVTCYAKSLESDPTLFELRILEDPVIGLTGESVQLFNNTVSIDTDSEISASDITLKDSTGKTLTLLNPTYSNTSKVLKFEKNPDTTHVTVNDVLYATYTYTTDTLPYAPMITISRTFAEGANSFVVENTDLTSTLGAGYLIRLTPQDTQKIAYFKVAAVSIPNGVNSVVTVEGTFSEDIRDPEFLMSDAAVTSTAIGFDAYSIGYGNTSITIKSDLTSSVKIGKALIIGSQYVHIITGFNISGGETVLTLGTPTVFASSASSVLSTIEMSDSIVYVEGDNAVVTDYPITGTDQPAITITHLKATSDESLESNSASVIITETDIQLFETLNTVESTISAIDYTVLDNLAALKTSIESITTGTDNTQAFSVGWVVPENSDIKTQYIVSTSAGVNPSSSLPYDVTVSPQVLRQREDETSYSALTQGSVPGEEDFVIIDGIIQLTNTLAKSDRFLITYQGADGLVNNIGSTIAITARYFATVPKNTEIKVGMEYLQPDQYYVQTMTETSFFNDVAFPYLDEAKKRKKGPSSFGKENNSVSDKGNAEGGIADNYYLIRDEQIKKDLYEKVYNYYLGRMGSFGKETFNTLGIKLGNNDFGLDTTSVLYNMAASKDIDHTATYGFSKLYPVGYDRVGSKSDERFETNYISYGEANFFNHESLGVVLGDNPEWLARNIVVGDQIRITGKEKFYTISTLTNDTMTLTEAIEDLADRDIELVDGIYYEVGFTFSGGLIGDFTRTELSRTGYSYEMQLQAEVGFPAFDNTGFTGARAETSVSEPYPLSKTGSYSNIFVIEYSFDRGITWGNFIEINLSALSAPFTSSKVAAFLLDGDSDQTGLSSVFKVSVENVYNQSAVDTSQSLSLSYPFTRIEKEEFTGVREAIIIRGNKNSTWFRFPEPEETITVNAGFLKTEFVVKKEASKLLGFPKGSADGSGIWYSGNNSGDNAYTLATVEHAEHDTKVALFNEMLLESNKFYRTDITKYKTPLLTSLTSLSVDIVAPINPLNRSLVAATEIIEETDASSAITTSFNEATIAITQYTADLANITTANSQNAALIGNVSGEFEAYEMGHNSNVITRQAAAALLETALANTGVPTLTLTASGETVNDPRILTGDGTVSATVDFDSVSYAVFPYYESNSNMLGLYERNPFSSWDSITTAADAMKIAITVNNNFRYEIDIDGITLYYFVAPDTETELSVSFLFAVYSTIGELVDAINVSADASGFTASIIYGLSDSPTTAQIAESRAVHTSFLATSSKTNTFSSSKRFSAVPVPYSAEATKGLVFSEAFTISGSSVQNNYTITDESITLFSSDGVTPVTTVLPFVDYNTIFEIVVGVDAVAGFSASLTASDSSYKYGTLARIAATDITGSSSSIYFGVKGDIKIHTISDANINSDISNANARIAELTTAEAYYLTRLNQMAVSVGPDGEKLKNFQKLWIGRLVHREEGPCAQIKVLKEQLIRAEEEESL